MVSHPSTVSLQWRNAECYDFVLWITEETNIKILRFVPQLTSASQCQRTCTAHLTRPPFMQQPITQRRLNRTARVAAVRFHTVLRFLWQLHFSALHRWQQLTAQGIREEREPSFPAEEGRSPQPFIMFLYHWRYLKKNVFPLFTLSEVLEAEFHEGLHTQCILWRHEIGINDLTSTSLSSI